MILVKGYLLKHLDGSCLQPSMLFFSPNKNRFYTGNKIIRLFEQILQC